MIKWNDIIAEVSSRIKGDDILFFRGHANASWSLVPGLGRMDSTNVKNREEILYSDFRTLSGPLLSEDRNSWKTIFLMQHHGLPTRLLDWSGTFGIALYFALKSAKDTAAVWILDPFELNKHTINKEGLFSSSEMDFNYEQLFISKESEFEGSVAAFSPPRHQSRLFSQGGYFTLHRDLDKGLEIICPSALKKVEIPHELFPEAETFLKLAGINEFSLFPDLDGLCRHIRKIDLNE